MKYKVNCLVCFNDTILRIIDAWEEACIRTVSNDYEPTVTSAMDGTHSRLSGHYFARSIDFRSKDVPFELRQNLKNMAQEILGVEYLVILEDSHYHIQKQLA